MEIAEEFIGMVSAVNDSMDRIYQAHDDFKIKLQQAFRNALLQHLTQDKALATAS